MTEPRTLATAPDTWLTDSRVYNLIWLGRWLERAEGISRAVNSAAHSVSTNGPAPNGAIATDMGEALLPVARNLGISVDATEALAAEIIVTNPVASVHHCLSNSRLNATQVAPVELIRAISAAIMDLEALDAASLRSPEQVINVTDTVADHIADIYKAIEDRWFGRESLTEEEVFHRFVQQ